MISPISKTFECEIGVFVTVRVAVPEDAEGVLTLAKLLLADGEGQVRIPEELSTSKDETREAIKKHSKHSDWLFLIAETEGRIVGCLDFNAGSLKRLQHRGIFGMGVSPSWRGKRIGTALLKRLVVWATDRPNLEKLCLAVLSTNVKAIGLYKKMGFQEEGRRFREVKYSEGCYADDILMYLIVK